MNSFGPHLMIDAWGCPIEVLDDLRIYFDYLNEVPEIIGMTKITQPYVFPYSGLIPSDRGITGSVIIAESHLSVHGFSEKGYVFLDVFSCKGFDTEKVLVEILKRFKPTDYDMIITERGLNFIRG